MKNNTSQCSAKINLLILLIFLLIFSSANSQERVITLKQTISLAADSSIQALNARNNYLQGYWRYHNFKVYHLPKITLQTNPMSYNRVFVKRYDSEKNIDIYRQQQSVSSSAGISIQQNVGLTGGTFFIDTELGYLKNFGADNSYTQFSSVPFRIGYSQNLFGFNRYKWDKIIEPMRNNKVHKQLQYNIASTSETATQYFFELAISRLMVDLAEQHLMNADTLYEIGKVRQEVGSLTKADLLTLKVQQLNSKTALEKANLEMERNYHQYCLFLGIEAYDNKVVHVELPTEIPSNEISVEEAIEMAMENNPLILELREQELIAQRNVEETNKSGRFSAQISASLGFNQVANTLPAAYQRPLQQNMVSVNFTIPIVDWGVNKGKLTVAHENLKVTQATNNQKKKSFVQAVEISVKELNLSRNQIRVAFEAKNIAADAFGIAKELFILGKTDLNSVNTATAAYMEAQNGYVQALRNYWVSYYKVKKLTLWE